ncbi:sulfhydryl oxidase 1-like isoform X2 [Eurosta solidaginis]|uniref:sulfhydryl oxidase 1-like isoform X2 n=1 Tax=Eurosta solidaginis TaxID=178769 RepID=UPI0035310B7B
MGLEHQMAIELRKPRQKIPRKSADLEMAIHEMLFNEIPKADIIQGDQLSALKSMLQVLENYHPLDKKGDLVISSLNEFVLNANYKLCGANIKRKLQNLIKRTPTPMFSSNKFVGCVSLEPNKRGYTCSLWMLFHYLTIQSQRLNKSPDPLEVLTAIHGYVQFFFGCNECSNRFQEMVERREMGKVSSKAEAVLWLWEAHNEINNCLARHLAEDPIFPKIQFPSESSCPQCRKRGSSSTINWNRDAVLEFLLNIYDPSCIGFYGTDNESNAARSNRFKVRSLH